MAESSGSMDKFLIQTKRDLLASVTEYFGTTIFLLMGLGGIQAAAMSNQAAERASRNPSTNEVASVSQLMYIATSMALALLASSWTFFRISGSVFNPNVAIALVMTGALKPLRFFLYVIAEILAGITASGILHAILPGTLSVGCSLGLGTKVWQGLLIEAILTAILSLTVLFLAVEKHRATPYAPVAIGLVLFATHLVGVVFTGAAVNSARAFGPDVITGFKHYHWIYWIGPSLGSIVAAMLYLFLKSVDYEVLNPKQDSDRGEDSPDLKGIEVKMRRRTTQFEKGNDHSYPASIAPKPMPPNFGLVSAPFHASTYRPEMPDSSGPVNPLAHEGSRPQSPIMKSVNGVPSTHGAMSTITSTKQTHPKGFPSIFSQIEHHENVDRIEVLSPLTDGYAHQTRRKSQYPTSSVC